MFSEGRRAVTMAEVSERGVCAFIARAGRSHESEVIIPSLSSNISFHFPISFLVSRSQTQIQRPLGFYVPSYDVQFGADIYFVPIHLTVLPNHVRTLISILPTPYNISLSPTSKLVLVEACDLGPLVSEQPGKKERWLQTTCSRCLIAVPSQKVDQR